MRVLHRLAAAAAFLGAASAAQAQDINIIVVSHGQANDPFWSVVKNGVTQALSILYHDLPMSIQPSSQGLGRQAGLQW